MDYLGTIISILLGIVVKDKIKQHFVKIYLTVAYLIGIYFTLLSTYAQAKFFSLGSMLTGPNKPWADPDHVIEAFEESKFMINFFCIVAICFLINLLVIKNRLKKLPLENER